MKKNTERIEIRVTPELKKSLKKLAKNRRESLSDLVRGCVERVLTE